MSKSSIFKSLTLGTLILPVLLMAQDSSYTSYSSSFNQSAFIPDIALIVDMSYTNRNVKDSEQENLSLLGNAYPDYVEFNSNNGFNLNYAELTLHSDVDQLFVLDGVFHFNTEGVEIEEAYFTTRALPLNFKIKGGKFKSDFGRINSQHQHVWDFADAPLVYTSFLSAEGINNIGLQAQWLAPTPWYMMAGIELFQSGNGTSFSNESFTAINNQEVEAATAPNLVVAYLKNSIDIDDTTLILGINVATGANKSEANQFDGSSTVYDIDFTSKSYFDSYSYLTFQTEVMYRDMDGDNLNSLPSIQDAYNQAGLYAQLVYAYDQNWRTGIRYDTIFKDTLNDTDNNTPLNRYTVMAEYNPSEFTRLRAQYSHSDAFLEQGEITPRNIDEFILELNIAIGSHGAHSF